MNEDTFMPTERSLSDPEDIHRPVGGTTMKPGVPPTGATQKDDRRFGGSIVNSTRTLMDPWDAVSEPYQRKWLHLEEVLREKSDNCTPKDLEELFQRRNSRTRREEEVSLEEVVKIRGPRNECLLRVALDQEVPAEVLHILLQADASNASLYEMDTLQDLLSKEEDLTQQWMSDYLAMPLLSFILDTYLDKQKMVKELDVPKKAYSFLAVSITHQKELQELVNSQTIRRDVLAVMFLDFYAHCSLILLFMFLSESYLHDVRMFEKGVIESDEVGEDTEYAIFIYVVVAYFAFRELLALAFQGWAYCLDAWNAFDITEIVLVLVSTVTMKTGFSDDQDDREFDNGPRSTMVVTGAIVYLGMILFLRNTFLPFASFVSGTINIVHTLIPFMVITVLVLLAFMYMYYVQRFDEGVDENGICDDSNPDNFCSYEDSFHNVFGYLAGGPDDTTDTLDIVCGVVVVIIFLNVVIAIVSTAWDEATRTSINETFWTYRLQYIAEAKPLLRCLRLFDAYSPDGNKLTKYLDNNIGKRSFQDAWETSGSDSGGCLQAGEVIGKLIVYCILKYVVYLLLGFATCGYFWPLDIRTYVFCNCNEEKAPDNEMALQIQTLKAENNVLKQEKADLQEQLDHLKKVIELDGMKKAIYDLMSKAESAGADQAPAR